MRIAPLKQDRSAVATAMMTAEVLGNDAQTVEGAETAAVAEIAAEDEAMAISEAVDATNNRKPECKCVVNMVFIHGSIVLRIGIVPTTTRTM